jgi:chromate transporter
VASLPSRRSPGALAEVVRVFLKLGTIGFGGPAAHVAMMEDELVRRRAWLSRQDFLDLFGATHLVPGPNSTELAIHLGYRRAGAAGLVAAGVAFILPSALIVGALAGAYVRLGSLPQAAGLLYGVKPVIVAVIAQALLQLARTAVKTSTLAVFGLAAAVAAVAGVHELLILAVTGVVAAATPPRGARPGGGSPIASLAPMITPAFGYAAAAATPPAAVGLGALFLVFAKMGAVLFGSGYVLLAFLRADLVERRGWLTEGQIIDAVAVGQVTPGPVSTAATFVGYLLAGPAGAAAATLGMFLPAFAFVALSGPLVPWLRRSVVAARLLDGVNVASLALMAVVWLQLARVALPDLTTVALSVVGAVLLLRWRVNPAWLVAGGATVGLAASWLRASP